ncbi:Ubiquitin system component Cue [Gossypium australe]|uniref:Ubiquitin system component Cue n=1 Tax=Gossypium australe TaxID=47621 RepID=A0A5B6WC65_9ROSI|nr:Ubiquitin system component Cue [Gossypium australe]
MEMSRGVSDGSRQRNEQALLECGNDIDTAIKRLEDLCLGAAEARGEKTCPVEELGTTAEQGILTNNGEAVAAAAVVTIQNQSASENMPADGAVLNGWTCL